MLALVQRWLFERLTWLCSETRSALTGDALGSAGLMRAFCLSSFSVTLMQMGSAAPSLPSFVKPFRPETQWVPGESACAFFRDQWGCTVAAEWMRLMNALCAESVFHKIKIQGFTPMMPPSTCTLYVVIGFFSTVSILCLFPFAVSSF